MNKTQHRLLLTDPNGFSPVARQRLEEFFTVDAGPMHREQLLQQIQNYDVVFVRLDQRFDEEMFKHSDRLACIVTPTTGLNHIDVASAKEYGIEVLSLRQVRDVLATVHATAELTMGLILALVRKISAASRETANGGWNRNDYRGVELAGRVLGIVGFGRLGARVAHYARAFDMKIIAHDRTPDIPDWVEQCALEDLLRQADIVSLHVTSEPQNVGLIGKSAFQHFKPGAFLINTSRGEIIDEQELLTQLKTGHLGGAALDVLCVEYDSSASEIAERLRAYARNNENLLITPHIGGATFDSMHKTEEAMADLLLQSLRDGDVKLKSGHGTVVDTAS